MRINLLRRLGNWKTTGSGLAISAVMMIVFNSFDCKLPVDWVAWATSLLPAVLGVLSHD